MKLVSQSFYFKKYTVIDAGQYIRVLHFVRSRVTGKRVYHILMP